MATKIKALIDLNIILDTLQMREPFFSTSARVLAEAETCLSPLHVELFCPE